MKLEKTKIPKRKLPLPVRSYRRGFTAIEIAMVAAVIAILSLIVLPIFRNRVEDAKIAAAQADLNALMKAQQIVKADIDAYARLEDLDNIAQNGFTSNPPGGVTKEVPFFKYITPRPTTNPDPASRHVMTTQNERNQLAGTAENPVWRGPYIAFQRSITYGELRAPASGLNPALRYSGGGGDYAAIQDRPGGVATDSDDNRIPVDPWGNPYLFFPPNGNPTDPANTNGGYSSAVIYSMGPDGQPGDGGGANAAAYTRSYAVQNPTANDRLGAGDDLMVEF